MLKEQSDHKDIPDMTNACEVKFRVNVTAPVIKCYFKYLLLPVSVVCLAKDSLNQ